MGVLEGDEDDATTTSTASATSELTPRAIDSSSAAATPSMGTTPSDSLDRNVDPKEINMSNSSEDLETESEANALAENPVTYVTCMECFLHRPFRSWMIDTGCLTKILLDTPNLT